MTAANLHALVSLICELERCETTDAMRKAVTDPGLVADYYRRIKGTEGGQDVLRWLSEQLKGHINARALAAPEAKQ